MKWNDYVKKADFILIFTLLFVFAFSFFYLQNSFLESTSKYVSIQVNGKEIKKFKFGLESQRFPIRTEFGINIVNIERDGVSVIEANCPDKLDVKVGKIKNVGQTIVCLPNRLVIEIKSDYEIEVDVVN